MKNERLLLRDARCEYPLSLLTRLLSQWLCILLTFSACSTGTLNGGRAGQTAGGKVSDTQIVFEAAVPTAGGRAQEIFTMNLDGSKRTQLTHGGLNKFLPHFSPDGTRVLLYRLCSGDEAHSGVTLTDKTGSYRTWITNGFGADWNPVAKSGCCMPTSHSALDSQSSWSPIAFASLPLLGFDISRKTKYEEIRKSGKRGIPKEEKQARRALMGRLKWICQERSRSARITYIGNVAESQRGLWASVSIVYSPYGFFSPVSL